MPYLLISTKVPLEYGPTTVNDDSNNEDIVRYLNAKIVQISFYPNVNECRTPDTVIVVLNKLERVGYRVISSTGDGNTFVWTLHKPENM